MTDILLSSILLSLFGVLMLLKKRHVPMSARVLLSLAIGIGFGFFVRLLAPAHEPYVLESILNMVGNGYLAFLKMLVIPLILTSIVHAIIHLGSDDGGILKKISFLTCALLLGTTAAS